MNDNMLPAWLNQWRESLGLSRAQACRLLDVHPNTWTNYQEGRTQIPMSVALACSALAAGLGPWSPPRTTKPKRGKKAS